MSGSSGRSHDLEAIREEPGSWGAPPGPGHLRHIDGFAAEADAVHPGSSPLGSGELSGFRTFVRTPSVFSGNSMAPHQESRPSFAQRCQAQASASNALTLVSPGSPPSTSADEVDVTSADAETAIGELCNSFRVLSEALADLQREVQAHKILAKQQARKCEEAISSIGNELAEFRERSSAQAAQLGVAQSLDQLHTSMAALTERVNTLEQLQPGATTVREIPPNHNHCESSAALVDQVSQLRSLADELKSGQAELGQDIGDIVGVLSHSNVISGTLGHRGAGTGGSAFDMSMNMSTGGTSGAASTFGGLRKAWGEQKSESPSGTGDEGWMAQQIRELAQMLDMERKARTSEVEELRASFLSQTRLPDAIRGDSSIGGGADEGTTELPAALVALHMALAKELRTRADTSEAASSALRAEMRSELSQRLAIVEEVLQRVASMAESVHNDVDSEMRRSPLGGPDFGVAPGTLVSGAGASGGCVSATPAHCGVLPAVGGAAVPAGLDSGNNLLVANLGTGANLTAAPGASHVASPQSVGTAGSEAAPNVVLVRSQSQGCSSAPMPVTFTSLAPAPPCSSTASRPSSLRFTQLASRAGSPEPSYPGSSSALPGWIVPPTSVPAVSHARSPTRAQSHSYPSLPVRAPSPLRPRTLTAHHYNA